MGELVLFKEDFQSFKLGDFPYEPFLGAMGEYHYRPKYWYGGQWYDPTPRPGSGGVKTWMIVEENGEKFIEYSTVVKEGLHNLSILATGSGDWTDYTVSCKLRLLRSSSCAGLIFRYRNSLCFYALVFNHGELQLFKRNQRGVTVMAAKPYLYTSDAFYDFRVDCRGERILCWVNGTKEFEVEDGTYPAGRIAIGTLAPAQFTAIEVKTDAATYRRITEARKLKEQELAAERAKYPQPLLWKVINLRDFGAGRSIRFGHLTGTEGDPYSYCPVPTPNHPGRFRPDQLSYRHRSKREDPVAARRTQPRTRLSHRRLAVSSL